MAQLQDGYAADVFTELDSKTAGIGTIIWAMGHTEDAAFIASLIGEGDKSLGGN